jgi:hypothetical protein
MPPAGSSAMRSSAAMNCGPHSQRSEPNTLRIAKKQDAVDRDRLGHDRKRSLAIAFAEFVREFLCFAEFRVANARVPGGLVVAAMAL